MSWLDMTNLGSKILNFGEFLKTCVTRQVNYNRTKIGGKCQISKIQMRQFGWFSYIVLSLLFYLLSLGNAILKCHMVHFFVLEKKIPKFTTVWYGNLAIVLASGYSLFQFWKLSWGKTNLDWIRLLVALGQIENRGTTEWVKIS